MARRRMMKYSRRTGGGVKRSRVPAIVLCVALFLLLCFVISIGVGLLLGKKADGAESRPKYDFERIEYRSGSKFVKSIEGYHFAKGANAADYYNQGIEDFSLCLRHKDGSLDYVSEIAGATGFDPFDENTSLDRVVERIHDCGGRACGYFYVNSLDEKSEGVREVYKAYELSLISEMAQSGIDEILLLGITVTDENVAEVESFLSKASVSAQKTAIGVAVSLDTLLLTEQEKYYAARLKNACDYIALDLCYMTLADTDVRRGEDGQALPSVLESTVEQTQYYIKTYGLRLLFSKDYSAIYKTAVKLGVVDFQIVGS